MYKELPPEEVMPILSGRPANAQVRAGTPQRTPTPSLGMWNQYRRYGENFREKAREMVIKRMDKWGINTIANWSSQEIIGMNRKAFILSLGGLGMERDLMGLCDIWRPDYLQNLDRSIAATVQRNLDNPWLIGYFVANEPAWLNEEVRLCQLILDGPERPIQKALKAYLDKNDDTEQNRRAFIISSFDTFLHDVNRIFKKHDPNHLNMGIRFGDPDGLGEDVLKACATAFDVFSFNCYMEAPKFKMMDRAMEYGPSHDHRRISFRNCRPRTCPVSVAG